MVNPSKTMQAAVNPKKCNAPGLMMKLRRVAMIPMMVGAPGFLVHHRVRDSRATPIMSHRMGRWVRFQKMGVIVMFSTAQRAAERVIAVRSRVLNPSNTFTSITFMRMGNTLIKVFLAESEYLKYLFAKHRHYLLFLKAFGYNIS